jgi:hypothetical protein
MYALYQSSMNFWYGQMVNYQAQIEALLVDPNTGLARVVEEYSFQGGQGSQHAKRRDLEQAQRGLQFAEGRYLFYWKRCNGYGNVTMGLRRR